MELMPRIVGEFSEGELPRRTELRAQFKRARGDRGVRHVPDGASGPRFRARRSVPPARGARRADRARPSVPDASRRGERLSDMRRACAGPLVCACGYKQFFDGVSSQHTAWLRDAYENARVRRRLRSSDRRPCGYGGACGARRRDGRSVRIHAIGDAAIHRALDIFGAHGAPRSRLWAAILGGGRRGRIGSVALPRAPRELPARRYRAIGAAQGWSPRMQPRHITLDPGGPERDLGYDRALFMCRFAA